MKYRSIVNNNLNSNIRSKNILNDEDIKYKALREDNSIMIPLLEAIFNDRVDYSSFSEDRGRNKRIEEKLTKEALEYYLEANISIKEISINYEVSTATISRYIKKYGINTNKVGRKKRL